MEKEKDIRKGHSGDGQNTIYIVGIGPGGLEHLTLKAKDVLASVDSVVGYTRYVELIEPLIKDKEVFVSGMTHEVERCRKAVDFAKAGKSVAVVSSGDAGIYGMAGLVFELLKESGIKGLRVEVVPGVPAFVSAAAILGAPLMHDFASISLSDLLTEWDKIEKRIEAAASGDFVIILYNPKSGKRKEGLPKAIGIISRHRDKNTPAGIVRNATRDDEEAVITTLGELERFYDMIDMLTIVVIGNSSTFTDGRRIVTPRGYRL